jgi:hypothetical protein
VKPTFLIFSQVYVPDPAAVGQHLADAAAEMVRRGYRVVVYTARNGYEDPDTVYARQEVIDGVQVRRLPFSSFGKTSIKARLLAQIIYLLQAMFWGLFTRGLAGVLVSTSPPACGIGGAIVSGLRRVPLKFWVMDINPDQLVIMNVLPPKAWPVRLFDFFNWVTLKRARDVVVLDRFMAQRMATKATATDRKTHVLPPWPLEPRVENITHLQNPFRQAHVPAGKRVLMYSGNHTPANPLGTLLQAVEHLQHHPQLHLMSIGGGAGKKEVDALLARGVGNITSLPYQPLDQLRYSLSAADVHVVSIGNDMVGVVHPCKVYGAMAVSRPVLMLGPAPSHLSELIDTHGIGWRIAHGDVQGAQRVLQEILATPEDVLRQMGQRAAAVISGSLGKAQLQAQLCDILQAGLPQPPRSAANQPPAQAQAT